LELAEYLTAYQNYWSENLSKLLAIKASETITVDAELLRLIAELDEPTYLQVLGRLKQLLELASPLDTATLANRTEYLSPSAESEVSEGHRGGVAVLAPRI
jgi:type VI protein secretion system component VasK